MFNQHIYDSVSKCILVSMVLHLYFMLIKFSYTESTNDWISKYIFFFFSMKKWFSNNRLPVNVEDHYQVFMISEDLSVHNY